MAAMKKDDEHDAEDTVACPQCGGTQCGTIAVMPVVRHSHFNTARQLVDEIWQQCNDAKINDDHTASIMGLTAALILKRIAVRHGVPRHGVDAVANMYLEIAHRIIEVRRAEAREAN